MSADAALGRALILAAVIAARGGSGRGVGGWSVQDRKRRRHR